MNPCIYAICDPVTNKIVYIGKTDNLDERIKQHIRCAKRRDKRLLYEWMASCYAKGLTPGFKVIKRCRFGDANKMERHYINKFVTKYKLFNVANIEKRP